MPQTGNGHHKNPLSPPQKATTAGGHQIAPVRGYLKLSQAASDFNFAFRGKVVLDIGSSTGGFTQYALDHGATKVIAVEKGTNQMHAPLRYDPRIELHEKTDIFDFKLTPPQDQPPQTSPRLDVIVADVSFLSLTKILKYAKLNLARSNTDFLVMLKPQFEAAPHQLHQGVVKNETIRRDIIKNFEHWLKSQGFTIIKKHDNILKGKTGNRERFYWLRLAK
ncbi:TlyA family rRNA (cytidine-2'-O)-methyltransferase [Candidatus Saccharibacteria bacterium]|nr:TlyA family rRNA (cytidine-2'-O)-methyltransferase [Candidatus Saccharibacteria bacterium]